MCVGGEGGWVDGGWGGGGEGVKEAGGGGLGWDRKVGAWV